MTPTPTTRDWFKSSRSVAQSNCVEVAMDHDRVLLRDSKNPEGHIVSACRAGWTAFIADLKDGLFHGGRGGRAGND